MLGEMLNLLLRTARMGLGFARHLAGLASAEPTDNIHRQPHLQQCRNPCTGGASKPIDDRWKAIVDKAMAPNPEDRYPDARALLAAVQSLSSPSDEPGSGAHASEGASEARRADGSATRGSGAHSIDKSKKASSI